VSRRLLVRFVVSTAAAFLVGLLLSRLLLTDSWRDAFHDGLFVLVVIVISNAIGAWWEHMKRATR